MNGETDKPYGVDITDQTGGALDGESVHLDFGFLPDNTRFTIPGENQHRVERAADTSPGSTRLGETNSRTYREIIDTCLADYLSSEGYPVPRIGGEA